VKTRIFSLVLVAGTLLNGGTQLRKHAPISVCELLENRLKYDGEMVEVRGILESSSHGPALLGAHCDEAIVIHGLTFPNAINLTYYLDVTSPHYDTVDFTRDVRQTRQESWKTRQRSYSEILNDSAVLLELRQRAHVALCSVDRTF